MPGRDKFKDFEDGESVEKYFPKVLKLIEEEEGQKQPGGNPPPCNGGQGGQGQGNQPDGDGDNESENEKQESDQNQSPPNGQGPKPMNFGMVKAPQGKSAAQADEDADQVIASAIMAAKEAGEGTGSVQQLIVENEKPVKIDWRAETSQFLERSCRGRRNYRHLNRRMFGSRIVFPTNKDKSPKRVILLVDVSGSMNDECVAAVYNHIEEIIKAKQTMVVELVPFDDGVFKDCISEFTRDNIPIRNDKRKRCGYGGTRFVSAAEFAEKRAKEDDVSGTIMLTDRLPCDKEAFERFQPGMPWLILSVLKHQFGNGYENSAANPKWCKILEIEP